jgi:hypothetical protein
VAARSLLKPLIGTPNHECYIRIEHMTTVTKTLQAGNCIFYGVRYSRSADVRRWTRAVISTRTHAVDSGRKRHYVGKPLAMNVLEMIQ